MNNTVPSNYKSLIHILDIDLDMFLNDIFCSPLTKPKGRLNSKKYIPWAKDKVISFIENQCNLKKPISGKVFTTHDELFYELNSIKSHLDANTYIVIDHVDAHADLGLGDTSFAFIQTVLLTYNTAERINHISNSGYDKLYEGNFMLYAIACGFINEINYITHSNKPRDLYSKIMMNIDLESSYIQLKQYADSKVFHGINDASLRKIVPIHFEPAVPFNVYDYNSFQATYDYDFIFLTKSPNYTPITSDKLIITISKYIVTN